MGFAIEVQRQIFCSYYRGAHYLGDTQFFLGGRRVVIQDPRLVTPKTFPVTARQPPENPT